MARFSTMCWREWVKSCLQLPLTMALLLVPRNLSYILQLTSTFATNWIQHGTHHYDAWDIELVRPSGIHRKCELKGDKGKLWKKSMGFFSLRFLSHTKLKLVFACHKYSLYFIIPIPIGIQSIHFCLASVTVTTAIRPNRFFSHPNLNSQNRCQMTCFSEGEKK